ncbi:hypothetical protein AgCh_005473 [Apium graveolens]
MRGVLCRIPQELHCILVMQRLKVIKLGYQARRMNQKKLLFTNPKECFSVPEVIYGVVTPSHVTTDIYFQPSLITVGQNFLNLSCEIEGKYLEKNRNNERQDPYLAKKEVYESQDLAYPCEKTLTHKSHEMNVVRSNEITSKEYKDLSGSFPYPKGTPSTKETIVDPLPEIPQLNSSEPSADIFPFGLSTDTFLHSTHISHLLTTGIHVAAIDQVAEQSTHDEATFPDSPHHSTGTEIMELNADALVHMTTILEDVESNADAMEVSKAAGSHTAPILDSILNSNVDADEVAQMFKEPIVDDDSSHGSDSYGGDDIDVSKINVELHSDEDLDEIIFLEDIPERERKLKIAELHKENTNNRKEIGRKGRELVSNRSSSERRRSRRKFPGFRPATAILSDPVNPKSDSLTLFPEPDKERQFQQHYKAVIDNISLDADTFTHPVSAFQFLAAQDNVEAEQTLHIVHTSESLIRDKVAVNRLPSQAGEPSEEFGVNSNDDDSNSLNESMNLGGVEGPSSAPALPEWALAKSPTPGEFGVTLVRQVMTIQKAFQETQDAGTKAILQAHLESLHLLQLQHYQQNLSVDELKQDIADLKSYNAEKLDSVIPYGTMQDLLGRMRKTSDADKRLARLEDRVQIIEDSMVTILQNQQTQTNLLMQLAKAQGLTPTLDDNKKGENKGEGEGEPSTTVQISQVLVPVITNSPPIQVKGKLDGIDLIQIAAAELQVKEQRKKIDEKMQLIFGSTTSQSQSVKHNTKVESIIMELKPVGRHKDGETSSKDLQPMVLKPNNSFNKDSTKNPLSLAQMKGVDFPLPKPDEDKLLGRSIIKLKENMDEAVRRNMAVIFREGKSIYVMQGHPKFSIAKREETKRLKEEAKQLKTNKRAQAKLEKQLKLSQAEEQKEIEDKGEDRAMGT